MIPLFDTLKTYRFPVFQRDVVAGLTTAIMLVPQGMAYAMLAGLEPIVGLYASTIPVALYAIFGSSRQLAVGPVAMVSLLVASGVGPLSDGDPGRYLLGVGTLALMVGVMQLGMGLARLGFLVRFLSHPVIAGFTSAAALIIGFSQLKHIMGVNLHRSHHVHEILGQAARRAGEANLYTLMIAALSVVILVVLKRSAPRFPRFLLVVVLGTAAVQWLGLDAQGVAIVGAVPAGLPSLSLPSTELSLYRDLLPIAVTISLVAFMESISVAKAFAAKEGIDVDADQELKGLGLANIGSAMFSGYPVTGGFSRTAVNAQAGAQTPIAGLITAGLVGITLVFFTPMFHYLPKAVLAAIIMTAVFGLIDVAEVKHLWKVSRVDLGMMLLTFVATLGLGIEPGIGIGVVASLGHFIWKTSSPHIAQLGWVRGTNWFRNVDRNDDAVLLPGVLIVRIDAPLYFANTAVLKESLRAFEASRQEPIKRVVLDAKGIGSIDSSGLGFLEELEERLHARGVRLEISGLRGPVRDVLTRAGFMEKMEGRLFEQLRHACPVPSSAPHVGEDGDGRLPGVPGLHSLQLASEELSR